jgi:ABC-type polysaccharide/polyol phosphate export permease
MPVLSDLVSSRELLMNLTLRELRGKFRGTVLGWGWSLLNPLASMVVFTLVFHYVFRFQNPPGAGGLDSYPLFLLCGLLPWNFLVAGLTGGMGAIIGNANLIKKTYFPRELLVISTVLSALVMLLIEMVVLLAALGAYGSFAINWLPVVLMHLILMSGFILGLSLALAAANVYFRDTEHFLTIALQMWFYLTPIIYSLTLLTTGNPHRADIAKRYHVVELFHLNPMTVYIEGIRNALYYHTGVEGRYLAYGALISVLTLVGGLVLFRRYEGRMAEEL